MASRSITTDIRGIADGESGWLLAIEGASGVGKTTAVAALASSSMIGSAPLALKLPSAGPLGQLARACLEQDLHETVALTAAADRAFVAEVDIIPALSAGRTVLVDRYVVSALALNRLDGIPFDHSYGLCARLPRPDQSILLLGDPAAITERLGRRDELDRYERGEVSGGTNEHEAFLEAADYLRARGWHITQVDTARLDVAQTVAAIEATISRRERTG